MCSRTVELKQWISAECEYHTKIKNIFGRKTEESHQPPMQVDSKDLRILINHQIFQMVLNSFSTEVCGQNILSHLQHVLLFSQISFPIPEMK